MKGQYPLVLLGAYILVWIWAAINPSYFAGWLSENILVIIFLPLLILTHKRFPLSNISYTLIFLFLVLHAIGSHYTYAEVPFGYWMQDAFGFARNHYDRLVHFSFGLLLAYPVREVFLRLANTTGVWGFWFPLELTLAFSAIYELIEWGAAVLSPHGATGFLATQGDEFDAQKDMALAFSGAFISMAISFFANLKLKKTFKRELKESVKVDRKLPLGEKVVKRFGSRKR